MTKEEWKAWEKAHNKEVKMVGIAAHEICLMLEEKGFTYKAAKTALKLAEFEIDGVADKQKVKAAEYAVDKYGHKIEGSPDEEDKPDDPAEN